MTVTVDNYTRVLLTVIAILLSLVTVSLWVDSPLPEPRAQAAIPDSGDQLNQLIETVAGINRSIGSLEKLLVSGEVRVQVLPPVEKKDLKKPVPAPAPAAPN